MQFRCNAAHTGDYSPVAGSTPPNNQLKWKFTASDGVDSPTVANGIVYVKGGALYAIDAASGAKIWQVAIGGPGSVPAISNGVVYRGGYSTRDGWYGNIYALSIATGATIWNFTTRGYIASAPTVANGIVYVGEARSEKGFQAPHDHNLYLLKKSTTTCGKSVCPDPAN